MEFQYFQSELIRVSRVDVALRAESSFSTNLKFYRTYPGKSTSRTQKDTEKANFQCTTDEKTFTRSLFLCKK